MKLFSGLVALLFALLISGVAGWFSVIGLGALFAATFWPVIVMGTVLETGKLVAAGWLHANWSNPRVNILHKTYLTFAVLALMLVTAIGIYGYLSKGYLEQEAPLASTTIQIEQRETALRQKQAEIVRLGQHQEQLDAAVNSLIEQRHVLASQRLRDSQKAERAQIAAAVTAATAEVSRLTEELVPLRLHTSEVRAKLGPVKYVADLFGWQDPNSAVRLVILVIMFAFDPLAVVLVLSGTISIGEWSEARRARMAKKKSGSKTIEEVLERFRPRDDTEAPRDHPKAVDSCAPLLGRREPNFTTKAAIEEAREISARRTPPVFDVAESRKLDEARSAAPVTQETDPAPEIEVSPVEEMEASEERGGVMAADEPSAGWLTDDPRENMRRLMTWDHLAVARVNYHHLNTRFEVATPPFSQAPITFTIPTPQAEPKGDMDTLVALLEKRPDLLDEMVSVIMDWRERNAPPVTRDEDGYFTVAKPPSGPESWLK